MKKVSIISLHLGYGGIEKSVCALANMLVKNYDVEIACVYNLYDNDLYNLDKNVKIKYLTNIKPNIKEFRKALKEKKLLTAFLEGIKGVIGLAKRKNSVVKYIRKTNSDIIISTRDIFDKWLGNNFKKGVLTIGWEHNHFHGDIKIARKLIRSCRKLDYLVVVSNNLKEYYEDKLKKTKVVYIPNVLDNIPKEVSKLNNKNIVCIGRLSKEKGYMDLLDIFNDIHKIYDDWILNIIGDGDEKENIKNYIINNKLEKSIVLHGFQNKDYIDKILNGSSIYLMTSYTESFGIVLIEAMSHGIPCISYTSAEGANEIIENNINGYLINNRNKDEYIEKLELLIDDYNLRKKLGNNARNSIYKYESKNVENDWFDILRRE